MFFDKDALAFAINNITVRVDKVSFVIDAASDVIHKVACISALGHNVAASILIKDAHDVLDVETLARVVEKLLDVTIVKLLTVKLLASMFVNNVAVAALNEPAEPVHSAALFVDVEALLSLKELWDSPASALVVLEFEVAHEVVRVKVEFFDTERCRYFTLVIDLLRAEHLLFGVVLEDIARGGVLQITTNICLLASLVDIIALTILKYDDVATLITIKLTQDIINIERAMISIWRHFNWMSGLLEVLD